MKRRVGLIIALAVGAGGVLYLARTGFSRIQRSAGADVPLHQVEEGLFLRTVTAEGFLKPVTSTGATAPSGSRSTLLDWVLEDGTQVKKGDVLVRFDDTEHLRNLQDNRDERQAADHKITREKTQIQSAISERDRTAALTREEIIKAKELGKKDPRYFPRNEVIESDIDEGLLSSRLTQTEAARKVETKLARTRVALIAVERQKAEIETKNAEKALKKLELRASHAGTWVLQRWGNRVLQAGDRAFSGMRIGEVATNDKMDAEVFVLEADAGGLVPGKRATVVLEARPDRQLKAKVTRVDPFPKPRSPEVPAQYFGAIITIEDDVTGMKPGQRLRAIIAIEEVPKALAVPRQAVFRNDKGAFVQRQRAWGEFDEVPVKLGPATVGRIVVTDGLKAGDQLALRDPKRTAEETVADLARRSKVSRPPPGPSDFTGGGEGRRGGRMGN